MAHKSESTSPQIGVETSNEIQLEELNQQIASDVSITESKAETEQPGEADIEMFMHIAQQLESELCSIVVGQERVIRELLLALFAGGHVLLEGVPGLGKTLLVRTQSAGSRRVFSFQPGPIFANIVLADEINRATPKTQSALLEGMQEHTVSVGDATRPLPRPFFVLGTQNPLEMEGTYPLPEAQLDRFLLKVLVSFPKAKDLMQIIDTTVGTQTLQAKQVASGEQLMHLIKTARAVPVATHVKEYAVRLLLATHPAQEDAPDSVRKYVRYGASPRGLQALIMTGKVRALLEGRYNVSLEDLQNVAFPSLRHRIILNFDGLADGVIAEDLIETIVEETSTS